MQNWRKLKPIGKAKIHGRKLKIFRKLFVGMKNEHKLMSDKVSELENLNKNLEQNLEVTKKVSESLSKELAESEKKRTRAAVVFKGKGRKTIKVLLKGKIIFTLERQNQDYSNSIHRATQK